MWRSSGAEAMMKGERDEEQGFRAAVLTRDGMNWAPLHSASSRCLPSHLTPALPRPGSPAAAFALGRNWTDHGYETVVSEGHAAFKGERRLLRNDVCMGGLLREVGCCMLGRSKHRRLCDLPFICPAADAKESLSDKLKAFILAEKLPAYLAFKPENQGAIFQGGISKQVTEGCYWPQLDPVGCWGLGIESGHTATRCHRDTGGVWRCNQHSL